MQRPRKFTSYDPKRPYQQKIKLLLPEDIKTSLLTATKIRLRSNNQLNTHLIAILDLPSDQLEKTRAFLLTYAHDSKRNHDRSYNLVSATIDKRNCLFIAQRVLSQLLGREIISKIEDAADNQSYLYQLFYETWAREQNINQTNFTIFHRPTSMDELLNQTDKFRFRIDDQSYLGLIVPSEHSVKIRQNVTRRFNAKFANPNVLTPYYLELKEGQYYFYIRESLFKHLYPDVKKNIRELNASLMVSEAISREDFSRLAAVQEAATEEKGELYKMKLGFIL